MVRQAELSLSIIGFAYYMQRENCECLNIIMVGYPNWEGAGLENR